MATFLWFLILITSPLCIYSASHGGLGIELTGPLIDNQSPSYHGSYELTSAYYDINYFVNHSVVDLCKEFSGSFLYKLNAEDVIFKVFEFLEGDLIYLAKVVFTSKRLLRLLLAHITRRFFQFNPKIFWLLPPQTRLRFALHFLHKFEKQFPGLRGNVNLTLDDLTVLMFVTLHCKNVFFISKSDFELIYLINPNFKTTGDTKKKGLPFYAASVWRSIFTYDAVQHDAFYAIESLCKIDPEIIENVVKQFVIKLGNLEKNFGQKISRPFELLLKRIIVNDQDALKTLLVQSIDNGAISTFTAFLPLWTGNLDQLGDGASHVLFKIAENRLSCPEILSRPELTHFQLSLALFNCKNVGNSDFALELLSRFPSNVFADHFDPHHLNIIKQIVVDPDTTQPLQIPQNLHLPIALLLASFHFNHPNALAVFSQLIRGNNQVLENLKNKRTKIYFEIAKRQNRQINSLNTCTLS